MKIHVTQEHIDMGIRNEGCDCPVALAIKDSGALPGPVVEATEVWWASDDPGYEVGVLRLPIEAVKFIADFDFGKPVAPFSFDLVVTP